MARSAGECMPPEDGVVEGGVGDIVTAAGTNTGAGQNIEVGFARIRRCGRRARLNEDEAKGSLIV